MGIFEVLKLGRTLYLLDAIHKVAFLLQLFHSLFGGLEVLPIHAVFAAQCRLVDFGIWRSGGDTAKLHRLYSEGIAGAEHASHII